MVLTASTLVVVLVLLSPGELDGFPQHLTAEECAAAVAAASTTQASAPAVEEVPDLVAHAYVASVGIGA
ncbi:hypothetical protein [Streptomyces sp. NPDC002232]|uniref:hypothetical protein n=1 Tax=Streptomyces sp. NPDC002232 TaxID=3364640 RepID=UPI00367D7B15